MSKYDPLWKQARRIFGDDRHRVWQQQVAFQNMNLSV